MAAKPPRRIPEELAATREEIDRAIETLTGAQLLRLHKFAAWRIRGLGRASPWHEVDELLNEAMASTLAGAENPGAGRHWNKKVDFVKHLIEAMRSVSDHQKRKFDEEEAQLDSELITVDPEGEESSPLDNARSDEPLADRAFFAKEEVTRIFKMFEGDDAAILVLQGWVEGMTGPEIMAALGLTRQQYEATVKRIRYAVRPNGTRGGQSHAQ